MEVELEPRVKALSYKVKAMSRESPAQKAAHLLDTDLRNHWSTGTNTKEWILLELDEPCLLSHIRIYNKSVLEWEISVGLRYKPETFVKVRPRCEAPRRDMMYPMNYTPCRYVRISCMRGNPIALFFVQLIGISVPGLEAEFQPVANYLLPYIISHKQDAMDMHLQLLQDVTSRLARFLPHLEADLNSFAEAAEHTMRFLAMLAGPFYPILHISSERENARLAPNFHEASKINMSSTALTVSSNFEPRRSRTISSVSTPISMHLVFRSDAVFLLLRKAYKDPSLGNVCRTASRILLKFTEPMPTHEVSALASEITYSVPDETPQSEHRGPISLPDYSNLFGDEFQIPCDSWDPTYLNVLDSTAVEEGLMHVVYASASQPLHCSKLAENTSDLWLALPLIQALLPALRPNSSSPYQIDDKFSLWKQPFVQNALSQIVATSSSATYCPLLWACAGYLASFSPSHAKAACVLIDLCSGILAPWTAQVIAKVDLTIELLEDLMGVIQGAQVSFSRSRAALKYIVLMLSGNMDDLMAKYKDSKYLLLFLVEMLEPYLDPSLTPLKGMIAFGNVSSIFSENQEKNCATAINIIRTAVRKSAVLPSLEAEWRRGSVAPSVLLSVLDPQMQLPPDIDNHKFSSPAKMEPHSLASLPPSSHYGSNSQEITDAKVDTTDSNAKVDVLEDANLLFAPPELNRMSLIHVPSSTEKKNSDSNYLSASLEVNSASHKNSVNQFPNDIALDAGQGIEFYNLLADYSQLTNYRDCELRASEFRRLALNLISQNKITQESHDVAIDALLLAAECYINPYFMMYLKNNSSEMSKINPENSNNCGPADMERTFGRTDNDLKLVADIERRRDRIVLEILIEAAELDRKYSKVAAEEETLGLSVEGGEDVVNVFQQDILSADAITLVRQNQALLCNFLIQHLQRDAHREQHPRHEILMWCLLFLLHSATKLICAPEQVVDVILKFAESFNMHLKSLHYQLKEEDPQLNHFKLHEVRRCWNLLQNLVIASSGNDERSVLPINVRNGFRFSNLVPTLAWLQKVPAFSSSPFPIVRYFGWMAVARNAKQFLDERLFLVSDMPELTYLLSIFSDDLSVVDNIVDQKHVDKRIEQLTIHPDIKSQDVSKSLGYEDRLQSFHALYPVISKFFPNLKEDFIGFGETILEAVGLQVKFLSTYMVPDLMCWFSDLCSCPFVQSKSAQALSQDKPDYYKGFVAKNAKAVILYILEAIVVEHMEAMVPEIPRVVQVFVSLCHTSYCDVSFLESILHLLKPIIAYSLSKVPAEEDSLIDDSCDNFESLCFSELFQNIKSVDESLGTPVVNGKCQALTIYVLASIFGNLSFQRKTELLQSALLWADFASSDGTNSFPDYICAYQVLMENCRDLLIATSKVWGVIPLKISPDSDTSISSVDGFFKFSSWFLNDICNSSSSSEMSEKHQDENKPVANVSQNVRPLTLEELMTLLKELEAIISKLNPTLEQCWRLHHRLSKKLALTCAECLLYSRCLQSITDRVSASSGVEDLHPSKFVDDVQDIWRSSLEGLSKMILLLQDKHCWEIASLLLDSLLGVPQCFCLDNVISDICFAIKNFSNSAPNISWRILTDKLIQLLLARGIHRICQNEVPLIDLFCAMLVHPEPEQRYIALKHLGRLVGQDVDGGRLIVSSTTDSIIATSDSLISANEQILSALVAATWDNVALMASSDTSLLLRTNATALLINFIPFAERSKLQSFLASADSLLQCLTSLAQPTCYGPLTQFSLALIASIFLYCPSEDISLIPESIWRSIETLGTSTIDRYCTSIEKRACEALCRLKNDGEQAKQVLREVLSSTPSKQQLPDFLTTRESILMVIGNLTSAKSYLDFFSKEAEEKLMELEEAEMEMEFLQKEHPLPDSSFEFQDWRRLPFMSTYSKDDLRLQQIKEGIRSIEKAKLREEIVARRQQKLLLRRARQKFLEEATLREAELIQKLDRERADEVEKELERQQLLELEQSKTRELRHNLEIEKEKQAQRDLQRELEQVESGIRPSRREFSSSSQTGRARDRYRERETSREGSEVGLRTSGRGGDATTATGLAGRGSFSGQLPTILQSRERTDEGGSSYEENFDGSKDSGDTGSVGDPDMVSSLEGQSISFGSGQRHGSRGGKSRQIIERRERDGRREGKWERKH